jgi:hypothetical protein
MMAQERLRNGGGGHHMQMINMLSKNSSAVVRGPGSASGTRIKAGISMDARRVRVSHLMPIGSES